MPRNTSEIVFSNLVIVYRDQHNAPNEWKFATPGNAAFNYAVDCLNDHRRLGHEAYLVDLNALVNEAADFVLSEQEIAAREQGLEVAPNPEPRTRLA